MFHIRRHIPHVVSPSGTSTGTHVSSSQHWASPHSSLHHMSAPWVITSSHVTCHVSHSSPGTQAQGRTARTQGWWSEASGDCTPLHGNVSSEVIIFISSTCAALLRAPAEVAILETLAHVPPGLSLHCDQPLKPGDAEATMEKSEKIRQSCQHFNTSTILQTKTGINMELRSPR